MILKKLLQVEELLTKDKSNNHALIQAVASIRPLFDNIDFNTEKVPYEDKGKLIDTLKYLKQDSLNTSEIKVAELITKTMIQQKIY